MSDSKYPGNHAKRTKLTNQPDDYADIINLPHFHAPDRPYMPMSARAAQFMPFKSLNAYHETIDKTEADMV